MSGLELDKEVGDGHAVQILFDAAWKDHLAGGKGLTHAELMEYARLNLNMSGTFQRYQDWQRSEKSTAVSEMAVDFRPDRADPMWVAAAHKIAGLAFDRMRRNFPPKGGGGRDQLLIAVNLSGRPAADATVRYTVNVKDGSPVLPRVYRRPSHTPAGWVNYDPEAEKIGVAGHMETVAWLREAREEIARTKRRPAELHSLLERAIAIVSVTGR